MTAAFRLWQRAPVWRGTVLLAGLLTALAIAYPPVPPPPAVSGGSYAPPPAAVEPFPNAPVHSGSIGFGGVMVPLPAGDWRQLHGFHGGTGKGQFGGVTLLRFLGRRLTGAIMIQGSTETDPVGEPQKPVSCVSAGFPALRHEVQGPHVVCILARPYAFAQNWAPIPPIAGSTADLLRTTIATLQKEGIALPPVVLAVNTSFYDGPRLLQVVYHFVPTVPDPTPRAIDWTDSARLNADPARRAFMERATEWGRRWGDLVARAYGGAREPIPPDLAAGPQ